ncbi:WD repeat-containing protein 26 isoform X1 [Iris pallida]|uniref:WD repeat-containing protein 26 isoform X1 n=1 Tax=Iris pallida TaxID=29817 RepID=A0AAX6FYP2_IRIPA|nr:WD repeat-containing protein 26 isoform X1 [Iris pallida]
MDPNPNSQQLLGEKSLIDRAQLLSLIIQSLHSLGYSRSASALESESGIRLDSPEYSLLLSHALSGRWLECVSVVDSISELDEEARSAAAFRIWKQQFLELLGSKEYLAGSSAVLAAARHVLCSGISELGLDSKRVHGLARALVSGEGAVGSEERMKGRIGLLLDLVGLLPDWFRIPCGRLEHLVETAVSRQVTSCLYHNSPEEVSLYEDHECGQDQIPCNCSQTLCCHKNEIWFVQFSNNGEYLASSSSDCTAIIWTVKEDDVVSLKHILEGHARPVSFVAWSPDDTMLLTCGNREVLKLWDVESGMCKLTLSSPVNRVISSCAWFPNSEKIVCGSCEPCNCIYTCDLEGNELEVWEGERMPKVSDLSVTPDGHCLISICSNKEIWIRDFRNGKERVISEEHAVTSLSLSRDGKYLIVNLNSQEIHLWRIHESLKEPDRFRGHKQGKYVIRSCFGGSDCLFIASGSEDSQIFIWQRHHQEPIQVLSGHSMTVNCVSWNPTKPHMLASASDDCTIRIWLASKNPTKVLSQELHN